MLRQGRLGLGVGPNSHTKAPVNLLGLCGFSAGGRNPRDFTFSGFVIKRKKEIIQSLCSD